MHTGGADSKEEKARAASQLYSAPLRSTLEQGLAPRDDSDAWTGPHRPRIARGVNGPRGSFIPSSSKFPRSLSPPPALVMRPDGLGGGETGKSWTLWACVPELSACWGIVLAEKSCPLAQGHAIFQGSPYSVTDQLSIEPQFPCHSLRHTGGLPQLQALWGRDCHSPASFYY